MKYAIIDIGSNTMRTVIYQVYDGDFSVIINEKEFAEILSFVEENVLTDAGILRLCQVLSRMRILCEETNCKEVYCFATASLRGIENAKEVVDAVQRESGITINLLSGCEESYYDYIGLKSAICKDQALGFDLGGGSAQLFYYRDGSLIKSCSEPIGTLAMYNKYVRGLFPNSKERSKIVKRVHKRLPVAGDFDLFHQKTIYGMGGTARALAKLHRHLVGSDHPVMNYRMTLEELDEMDHTLTSLGLNGIKLVSRILPERLVTFIPGLIIIREMMFLTGTKELSIVDFGVREGYLIEHAVNQGRGFDEFKDSDCDICK